MMQAALGCAWIARRHVHRDLKPGNILIQVQGDGSYTVKIADFGFTVPFTAGYTFPAGTMRYMAPECFDGWFSEKTDVYSFGLIMLGTFTNRKCVRRCLNPELEGKNLEEVQLLSIIWFLSQSLPCPRISTEPVMNMGQATSVRKVAIRV